MVIFDTLWTLVEQHGSVAEFYKADLARLWDTYTDDQRQAIYDAIRTKLQRGLFVHYNPVKAVLDNAPKPPKVQKLSYAEYYAKYGTTEEQGGWKRVFMKDEQKTIYVKEN